MDGIIERLTKIRQWVDSNDLALQQGLTDRDPFVACFIHNWIQATVLGTERAVEAAEIALVELEADWEGK